MSSSGFVAEALPRSAPLEAKPGVGVVLKDAPRSLYRILSDDEPA